jgi:quinoprotein glucose dehydrogenase
MCCKVFPATIPSMEAGAPMTYVADDGRQMVVIASGGHGKYGFGVGDFVVAFALPTPQ